MRTQATGSSTVGASGIIVGDAAYKPQWQRTLRLFAAHRPALVSSVVLVLLVAVAVAGPWLVEVGLHTTPVKVHAGLNYASPSREHLLGTDDLGRDMLARVVSGIRISLSVGLLVVFVSSAIGVLVGSAAGAIGGRVDGILMLISDTLLGMPTFYLLLAVASYFSRFSILGIVIVIALTSWMGIARVVRAEFMSVKQRDHVLAARALGARSLRIILRHILPNVVPTITVAISLSVASAILIESSLSFLGLGVQTPRASLGTLLSKAQLYVWTAPMLAVIPGMCIMIIVLAFNFLGDGLREALDPRLRI